MGGCWQEVVVRVFKLKIHSSSPLPNLHCYTLSNCARIFSEGTVSELSVAYLVACGRPFNHSGPAEFPLFLTEALIRRSLLLL